MILGLGSDIIDIRRIEKVIEKYGDRFLERIYTPVELAKAMRRTEKIRAATFAKRFAANRFDNCRIVFCATPFARILIRAAPRRSVRGVIPLIPLILLVSLL